MRVLIIVLGVISTACAVPRQSRIIGGETTTIEEYPFMAGMLDSWDGVFYLACGGTLITPTSVLSAAHCFEAHVPSRVRVRLGSEKFDSGGIEHLVSRITLHPEYNPESLTNDILIMRLSDPAVYSDKINRARIAGPGYFLPADTVVHTLGWGDIQEGGPGSEILRHVAVNVIDPKICATRYGYPDAIPSYVHWPDALCTGILDVGGKDACTGDSGGPVIHNRDVLVGIVSTGYYCAHHFYPGINVRVSSYTDWIYENSVN